VNSSRCFLCISLPKLIRLPLTHSSALKRSYEPLSFDSDCFSFILPRLLRLPALLSTFSYRYSTSIWLSTLRLLTLSSLAFGCRRVRPLYFLRDRRDHYRVSSLSQSKSFPQSASIVDDLFFCHNSIVRSDLDLSNKKETCLLRLQLSQPIQPSGS